MPRYGVRAATVSCLLLAAGCGTEPAAPQQRPTPSPTVPVARTAAPAEPTVVLPAETAVDLALATSGALYLDAPVVVLAGAADEEGQGPAADAAVEIGAPLLLLPEGAGGAAPTPTPGASPEPAPDAAPEVTAEVRRLGATAVLTFGDAPARWAAGLGDGVRVVPGGTGPDRPPVLPAPPLADLLVLALDGPDGVAAAATARASGARVVVLDHPDPRRDRDAIGALAGEPTDRLLALGERFGSADRLRRRVDTAATGVELPGGGQVLFPGRRMVALYGHPGDAGLGVLGEQGLDAAITRARRTAEEYESLVDEPVVPTFEIITTVASASAGSDGDYSSESDVPTLRPWVEEAGAAGVYVVLDLQPGRTDFLTQAKRYEELLAEPHVGLALDPEWRLGPSERHMVQIGSVRAGEVNDVASWLAELTRRHRLPQKLLVLHQFRLDMITDRASVETGHDELAVLIHADGFGSAGQKFNTWNALHAGAPDRVWWGWKNFYDEDQPTFTPRQTVAVDPSPVFVSYQ
jgi:hypothetical protein